MILSFGLEVHLQFHLTQTLVPFKEGYDLKGKNDVKALLKLGRLLVVFLRWSVFLMIFIEYDCILIFIIICLC